MTREHSTETSSLATIVMVPRERFSTTKRSLASLYQHTRPPFDLIYVDGGSPRHIAHHLAAEARLRGFRLIQKPQEVM